MTINQIKLTTKSEQIKKEMSGIVNNHDKELFEKFYDPGMEPLTKEEWVDILTKYDDSFKEDDGCNMNNIIVGQFHEFYTPCEELLTKEEWAEILERFDKNEDEHTAKNKNFNIEMYDAQPLLEELESKYLGKVVEYNDLGHNNESQMRKRKRLPRRGGRSRRRYKGTADLNILHSNCDGYISKKDSIENIVKERKADVLLLNETSLKGKRKVKIKD
jgi:hypothetical protein